MHGWKNIIHNLNSPRTFLYLGVHGVESTSCLLLPHCVHSASKRVSHLIWPCPSSPTSSTPRDANPSVLNLSSLPLTVTSGCGVIVACAFLSNWVMMVGYNDDSTYAVSAQEHLRLKSCWEEYKVQGKEACCCQSHRGM